MPVAKTLGTALRVSSIQVIVPWSTPAGCFRSQDKILGYFLVHVENMMTDFSTFSPTQTYSFPEGVNKNYTCHPHSQTTWGQSQPTLNPHCPSDRAWRAFTFSPSSRAESCVKLSDFPSLGEELSGGYLGKMGRGRAGLCRAGLIRE